MKAAKWRDRSDDELTQDVRGLAEEIRNLRFQLAMGVAKNPSRFGEARRDLARIYTILGERGGRAAVAAAGAPLPTPSAAAARPSRAAKRASATAPRKVAGRGKAETQGRPSEARRAATPRRTKAKG